MGFEPAFIRVQGATSTTELHVGVYIICKHSFIYYIRHSTAIPQSKRQKEQYGRAWAWLLLYMMHHVDAADSSTCTCNCGLKKRGRWLPGLIQQFYICCKRSFNPIWLPCQQIDQYCTCTRLKSPACPAKPRKTRQIPVGPPAGNEKLLPRQGDGLSVHSRGPQPPVMMRMTTKV